jgi:glycosyltransferase involved in cell wall biosynthesis
MSSKGKLAWCLWPVLGGMTTVYNVVGAGLRQAGWEVVGVSAGADAAREAAAHGYADEFLEVLLPESSDVRRNAAEFIRWVEARKIDVVFCQGQDFTLAAAPALPPRVRLIDRCTSMTRHSYQLAAANLRTVNKIIAESPRQRRDLVRDWKVSPEKCVIIPHGIEIETFRPGTSRDFNGLLRLLYLGRVEDVSKAVMMFPKIARQLAAAGVEFHFDILGDGPERDRLRDAFDQADLTARVTFHGTLRREETVPFLQRAHLFLLPSRFEGVPWALLETMSCGCVPIASRIAETTDFVVDHGVSGFLCTVGNASEFAQAIMGLAADRKRLATCSAAAVQTIRDRFTLERVVRDTDDLLQSVLAAEPVAYTPIPVTAIQVPRFSNPMWRRILPQGVKNYLRTWAERFQRTV